MSDETNPNPEAEQEEPDDGFHDPDALTAELVAFLDGELDRPASEAVGTKISLDSNVRAEADALKKTWDLLDHLPRPEPSQNFTERTLSRIVPVDGSSLSGSKSRVAAARASGSAAVLPLARKRGLLRAAVPWLLAAVAAGFGGYFISNYLQHLKDSRILTERRMLQRLHALRHVDDLEFLNALDDPDLFGEEDAGAAGDNLSAAKSTALPPIADPEGVDVLRSRYGVFQQLPAGKQEQLRKLDRDLAGLSSDANNRLRWVMERYNHWLANLSPEDRKRVTDATGDERLAIIGQLKDREWVETLPKAYRDKYHATQKEIDRRRLIDLWREEQRERREEWQFVVRNWADLRDDRLPVFAQWTEVRKDLDTYAANLESQLSTNDRERLRKTKAQVQEERWPLYPRTLVELSDRYHLLPGPADGPRTLDALPKADREAIEKIDRALAKKKTLPKELANALGRWPDFAIAVTEYARQHQVTLPEPLGPTDKESMPPELKAFIADKLEPVLRKSPADLAKLKDAEGKWPDYPRAVMDLAKQYKLTVPGWMLPGKADVWERFRVRPKK